MSERNLSGGWDSLTFRVDSASLHPAQISKKLELEPTESYEKGSPYYPDQPTKRQFDSNIWLMYQRSLDSRALTVVTDLLYSRASRVAHLADVAETSLVWHVKLPPGQETATIAPETLAKLAELRTGLTIAVFP